MNEIIKWIIIILLPLVGYAIGREKGSLIGFIIGIALIILRVL